ncbi:hypothetical protein HYFRA_00011594 [Hymenoscyphus fraxineus]|uniref:Pyrroloquinoline quinone-dependent pyranose dehydrogenase beta-propeller domain-containing protein n=1 Tax=Hymenoscyphus fraxineus TaxID=746836 RepID=A0A9N9L205_9HELO|nr:hypothetical protein HYFRA_00011594 [Hymenoscyphus fraxineus]
MFKAQLLTLLLSSLSLATAQAGSSRVTCNLKPPHPAPVTHDGWSAQLVTTDLNSPRSMIWDTKGNMIMADWGPGITHLTFNDGGGTCLEVAKKTVLIMNNNLGHGIALSNDGKTLYASDVDKVYAWDYNADDVTVSSTNRTIITGMGNKDHVTRTLLMSQKKPGTLLVSRGSDSNIDDASVVLDFGHSQIRAWDTNNLKPDSPSQDFATTGQRLGWGLRNSVGVAEEPLTGGIYSVENSADELKRDGVDIHQTNPGEEMNYHGFLNDTSDRGNYGYPNCFGLYDTNIPNLGNLTVGAQFSLDQNATVNDNFCARERIPPVMVFPAHNAPLDIKFQPNGSEAYVSFHGSWDRQPPDGYKIRAVPFANGFPVAPSTSLTGSTTIIENVDNTKCPDDCFRPVGLLLDNKGRLWFTSDKPHPELWVMEKNGKSSSSSTQKSTGANKRFEDAARL